MGACGGGERVPGVLDQRLAESQDGTERGPKVVRDRVAEGFEFPIGRFQIGGAFAHHFLKLIMGVFEDIFRLLLGGDVGIGGDEPAAQ